MRLKVSMEVSRAEEKGSRDEFSKEEFQDVSKNKVY